MNQRKRILLLHTGGTIGMVSTGRGLKPELGVVEAAVEQLLTERGTDLRVEIIRLDPLIDSANATPADWNRLATEIVGRADQHGAILITHGTDTLAFTSSALTMALEGLNTPVILTGSMIPLSVPDSDGWANLGDALQATQTAEPGVWIQFAGKLLRGPRARKIHSSAPDAFSAMLSDRPPRREGETLRQHRFGHARIAVVPVAPGCDMRVVGFAMDHSDGVVLRCYGSGTVPDDPLLEQGLARAADRGIPVVAVSETLAGGTSLGHYAAGAVLLDHGVIDGRDMTLEAAYAKLTLALATVKGRSALAEFVETPLCGEFGAPFPVP
ncbi:asparaginase [Nioella aestuarii]|uniref:asparaginase n=1 Tax=Nioella aestuarii TaxID=1662864 RepID=UPI003D7FB8E6